MSDKVRTLILLALQARRSEYETLRLSTLYRQVDDTVLWSAARKLEVAGSVAHALLETLGDDLPMHWREEHDQCAVRTSAFLSEVDRIAAICNGLGIRTALIEHGSVARWVHRCPGCFASNDLDVLVGNAGMAAVHRTLVQDGYRCEIRRSPSPVRKEYQRTLTPEVSFWLGIQSAPLVRNWVPAVESLTAEDLLSRAETDVQGGSGLVILRPEDNLLLCALHISIHGYIRPPGIRLYLDVDRIVCNQSLNWRKLVDASVALRCRRRVFLSLKLSALLLKTPVPPDCLNALVPRQDRQRALLSCLPATLISQFEATPLNRLQFARLELMLHDAGRIAALRQVAFPPAVWMTRNMPAPSKIRLLSMYINRLFQVALSWHP